MSSIVRSVTTLPIAEGVPILRTSFSRTASVALPLLVLSACAKAPEPTSVTSSAASVAEATVATTKYGHVRGAERNGVFTFQGIPYGASTAGKNRFMPPQVPSSWPGVRDALSPGDQCPQLAPPYTAAYASWDRKVGQSEDCLVLNVWTPGLHGGKRPVMVWFHGGGFAVGDGSVPVYDGTRLAHRGDVVVVTINHRLNLFGYMYLAGIGGEKYADSGNAGQLDLVAALQWVRDNIADFGGDPANVTIFGQSGGGAKVTHTLAMPAAQGLFSKAIVQSGAALTANTPEAATASAKQLMDILKVAPTGVDRLQELPASTLLEALKTMTGGMPAAGFAPVMDGRSLPRHPFTPDAPAISANVPVMVGYNKDETTVLFPTPDLFTLDWNGLKQKLTPQLKGKNVAGIIAGMRKLRPNATPTDLYFTITTEMMGDRSYILASRKAAQGKAPVWIYRLEWETPVEGGKLKTPHGLDLPLVFDTVAASSSIIGAGTADAQKLADTMSSYWISFARDGNPNEANLPQWPAYDDIHKTTMVFNLESAAKEDPVRDVRAVLLK
jgi:para-nitrobenzyl esterase